MRSLDDSNVTIKYRKTLQQIQAIAFM